MIPGPLASFVLALAVFRLWRIIGWDDFPPLVRARGWLTGAHKVTRGSTNARMGITNEPVENEIAYRRPLLAHFLSCTYCSGFWIALGFYGAWRLWPGPTLAVAFVLALSAAAGILAKIYDPP